VRVELNIKYFDHDDLVHLNDWLRIRGHKPTEMYDLPSIGFLVSEGDHPIAACFLRRCEGNVGIVEGLTSNPESTSSLRHVAIDAAIRVICEEAKAREISKLLAWTVDSSTLLRGCERHGFVQSHQTLLTKDLDAPTTH
jgi:N-acetylglutamate synthase-like GNAT family acetyltransferase